MYETIIVFYLICLIQLISNKSIDLKGICNQKINLEFEENGTLIAENLINFDGKLLHCSIEFSTCPSCIIEIQFRFLNISKNCDDSTKTVFSDNCNCDYVWIYEPQFQQISGNQFCGFHMNSTTTLNYLSQTRHVGINFFYSKQYKRAFILNFSSKRNRIYLIGYPKPGNINNSSQQIISTPYFPYSYPADLNTEQIIYCKTIYESCRISLIFTDFQIADSSFIELFDWNGQRIYVTTGNIFRPPIITSTGPSLVIRFYANGSSKPGYKATYSFILGGQINDTTITPFIDCGGYVSNLGGTITMMEMTTDGNTKLFDCIWLIKPPKSYRHMKTHLYVKIIKFANFALGNTELSIRQGLTSHEPVVEFLKYPTAHFYIKKENKEHVVPITQGFYIRLTGLFHSNSYLAISYAAFNYKDCFSGADFLCHNLRCISILLICDGYDHCGDNSDELMNCTDNLKGHNRRLTNIPNFLFPKIDNYYIDLNTTTLVILLFSLGIVALIFAIVIFIYRINFKYSTSNRRFENQQQIIQNNIETITAIFEEAVDGVEEEIIIPDDPPDYEPPPNYDDVIINCQAINLMNENRIMYDRKCFRCNNSNKPITFNKLMKNKRILSQNFNDYSNAGSSTNITPTSTTSTKLFTTKSETISIKNTSNNDKTHIVLIRSYSDSNLFNRVKKSEIFEIIIKKSLSNDQINNNV